MSDLQAFPAADVASRLAALDVGSNSIRLVVAEALPGGRYRLLDEEREPTRLGRSLASTGRLDEASIAASLAALRRFKSIAEGMHVDRIRAIATCAVREAANGGEFCQRVEEQLGVTIEVISAEKEAHLAFQSVRRRNDLTGKNTVSADIGGGSTEIIIASGRFVEAIYATKLGAVRLSEKFAGGQSLAGDDYNRMLRWIDKQLRRTTDKPAAPLHALIGSGGTFTSLAGIVMASRGLGVLPSAGFEMSRADVRHVIDRLRKLSSKARRDVPGLNDDRVDIIVPGLAVVDRIMQRFKVNLLQVHPYGVRDGLLLTMIEQLQGVDDARAPSEDDQIDRFAEACRVDLPRSKHVARLASQIYRGLVERFKLDPADDRLLRAAARLQDVGYLISYKGHHKHSYHLILHSRLDAFRPEELQLIANVARYHRGAPPKDKHANYRKLSAEDRRRVNQLAAVLRLAGGLDRSHNRAIRSVEVRGKNGQVELVVSAPQYPEVDLWAARRRAGPFKKEFEAELTVQWNAASGLSTAEESKTP